MICDEYKIEGLPTIFDGKHATITKILGNNLYYVATNHKNELSNYVKIIEYIGKCEVDSYEPKYIKSENFLAELITVNLDDPDTIQKEWEMFVEYCGDKGWHNRLYVDIEYFTPYFKDLLNEIAHQINLPYLDITLQIHDNRLHNTPIELDVPHRDGYRRTNITVPVYLDDKEKVNWHGTPQDIILQSSTYRLKHPSMVNVGDTHSVSLLPNTRRILIQFSYRESFDEIYKSNPDIFNLYK
jgi:hypothetical protein